MDTLLSYVCTDAFNPLRKNTALLFGVRYKDIKGYP